MTPQQKATDQANSYIKEFLHIAKEPFYSAKKLTGGTQYQTYLVNKKYIFKIGSPNKIKAEFVFNNYYKGQKFVQHLALCDSKYRYIVYNCIKGKTLNAYPNQKLQRKMVMKFIKNYAEYNEVGFGDVNNPSTTWTAFLHKLISDSKSVLKGKFKKEYFNLVDESIDTLQTYTFPKKLLHGDLRLENFIFEENTLQGIIDPYPMTGDALYDAIFFHFSTPEIATSLPFSSLHKKLKQPQEKVYALSLVVLYVKLKRMLKYDNHTEEFEFFKELFEEIAHL